jgi:hypothetical protein
LRTSERVSPVFRPAGSDKGVGRFRRWQRDKRETSGTMTEPRTGSGVTGMARQRAQTGRHLSEGVDRSLERAIPLPADIDAAEVSAVSLQQ